MEQTSEYATMTKDEFKKYILTSKPKSRCQLVYFILNALHNIIEAPIRLIIVTVRVKKNAKFAPFQ